ncbi:MULTISPECIES: DUF805 domain-containing protein [unclassified Caulobacter]|uniref:DUF805 domain-containing protein n=1 Tax=unclassified Caulobacter TaxID=2648921 RepID=UPI0006FCA80A|nr:MULTISPECIES: DUF805 domain-containing protein [unclassified Caulobacter]KQV56668.1 hypothetical protein ASC62_10115 [Caulobacter sp. Root342]KQV72305.1 hypothetical protein ASC70_01065 [Caulobacter sp. Root343]
MANTFRISVPSLLSFKGRLRRSHYWVTSFALGVVKAVLTVILAAALGQIETKDGGFAASIMEVLFLWPTLALLVKRGHDRNRSIWFSLGLMALAILMTVGVAVADGFHEEVLMIACVVVVIGCFGFLIIDYGFIDGTQGPNRYGPSSKGIGAESHDVAAAFD